MTGSEQTPRVTLVANPYYWDERYPRIEKITLFTQLETQEALKRFFMKMEGLILCPFHFIKNLKRFYLLMC